MVTFQGICGACVWNLSHINPEKLSCVSVILRAYAIETFHLTFYIKSLSKQLSSSRTPRQDGLGVCPTSRRLWIRFPPGPNGGVISDLKKKKKFLRCGTYSAYEPHHHHPLSFAISETPFHVFYWLFSALQVITVEDNEVNNYCINIFLRSIAPVTIGIHLSTILDITLSVTWCQKLYQITLHIELWTSV